uniref:RNA-directed RNA polymerase n=1 Tax=Hubei birna-like virus TaxID=1922838 RepID=A0A1L3KF76_9VIRU|nr:RNA-dependent RNA polymerase [Hubei birna-like virus]
MSNLFNAAQNRVTILQLLGVSKDNPSNNTVSYFPKIFAPPDTRISAEAINSTLRTHHIRILRQAAVPEVEEIAPSQVTVFNQDLTRETDYNAQPCDSLSLPIGKRGYLPKYYPNFFARPYDEAFFSQLLYQLVIRTPETGPDGYESQEQTFDKVLNTVRTHAYGNGSITGMAARLNAMGNIRHGIGKHKPKSLFDIGFGTYLEVSEILDSYFPIPPIPNDHPGLTLTPSFLINPDEGVSLLPHINIDSMAGCPYSQSEKKKTHVYDGLAACDMFLQGINKILQEAPGPDEADKKLKTLMADFNWMRMGYLFPKAERYAIKEWETKTRCIWSAPFATTLLLGIVSTFPSQAMPNALFFDTPCLAKFSPFHGGLQVILDKALAPGTHPFIYADNIYLSWEEDDGTHTWYSLDLEKGEANATPDKAAAAIYHLLTRGWSTQDGAPRFNNTWVTAALRFGPHLIVDPICVLGNQQFNFPGQGSGNALTDKINLVISAIVVDRLLHTNVPGVGREPRDRRTLMELRPSNDPESDFQKKFLSYLGVNVKVETEIKNLEKALADCKANTPDEGFLGSVPVEKSPTKTPPTVRVDLLGWSAAYSHFHSKFIPILDEDRLFKAAVLSRGFEDRFVEKGTPTAAIYERLYKVAKHEAIRLIGGYLYAILDRACAAIAENERSALTKTLQKLAFAPDERFWNEALKRTEFGEELPDISIQQPLTGAAIRALNEGTPTPTLAQQAGMDRMAHRQAFSEQQAALQKTSLSQVLNRLATGRVSKFNKTSPTQALMATELKVNLSEACKIGELKALASEAPAEQEKKVVKRLADYMNKAVQHTDEIGRIILRAQEKQEHAHQAIAPPSQQQEKKPARAVNPVAENKLPYPLMAMMVQPNKPGVRKQKTHTPEWASKFMGPSDDGDLMGHDDEWPTQAGNMSRNARRKRERKK